MNQQATVGEEGDIHDNNRKYLFKRIDVPPAPLWHGRVKSVCRFALPLIALLAAGCGPAMTTEPIDPNKKSYFVDVEYTVGTDGRTSNAKVINTDAPELLQKEALAEAGRWRAEPSADPSRARRRVEFAAEKEPGQ